MAVRSRRLEDRTRELCGRAVTAQDSELESIFSALQSSLREHNERLRKLAATKLTTSWKSSLGVTTLRRPRAPVACIFCSQSILLEDSRVSEDGQPMHEECCVAKLTMMSSVSQQT